MKCPIIARSIRGLNDYRWNITCLFKLSYSGINISTATLIIPYKHYSCIIADINTSRHSGSPISNKDYLLWMNECIVTFFGFKRFDVGLKYHRHFRDSWIFIIAGLLSNIRFALIKYYKFSVCVNESSKLK